MSGALSQAVSEIRERVTRHLDALDSLVTSVEDGDRFCTSAGCDLICNAAASAFRGAEIDTDALRADLRKRLAERVRHPARSVLPAVVSPAGAM